MAAASRVTAIESSESPSHARLRKVIITWRRREHLIEACTTWKAVRALLAVPPGSARHGA